MNRTLHTIVVGLLNAPYALNYEQPRRIFSPKGIAPTIHTMGGGNREIKILVEL